MFCETFFPLQIKERVKQLRELNDIAGDALSAKEKIDATATAVEMEQDEVQYSDDELVTTVVTTTEVVPLSLDANDADPDKV